MQRDSSRHLHEAKIYMTVVYSVALYGTECCGITEKREQAFHTVEMKLLRSNLGMTRFNYVKNEHVRRMLGVATIVEKVSEPRLR